MFWLACEGVVIDIASSFAGTIGIVRAARQEETQGKNEESHPESERNVGEESLLGSMHH